MRVRGDVCDGGRVNVGTIVGGEDKRREIGERGRGCFRGLSFFGVV